MSHQLLKSLGQHFLRHQEDAERIARSWSGLDKLDVLEVGPGDGRLTRYLLKNAKKVVAVEVDKRWVDHLWRTYEGHPGFVLRHNDITQFDWTKEFNRPFVLFGNLPYHLSSSILFGAIETIRKQRYHPIPDQPPLLGMVVMLQREVAERVAAQPGDSEYGVLSTFMQLFGSVEKLFILPPSAFQPPPKVYSAVIRVTFDKPAPEIANWPLLNAVIRAAYAGRRKMLRNTLPSIRPPLPNGFAECSLDLTRRPQTVSPEEWVTYTNELSKLGGWGLPGKREKVKDEQYFTKLKKKTVSTDSDDEIDDDSEG